MRASIIDGRGSCTHCATTTSSLNVAQLHSEQRLVVPPPAEALRGDGARDRPVVRTRPEHQRNTARPHRHGPAQAADRARISPCVATTNMPMCGCDRRSRRATSSAGVPSLRFAPRTTRCAFASNGPKSALAGRPQRSASTGRRCATARFPARRVGVALTSMTNLDGGVKANSLVKSGESLSRSLCHRHPPISMPVAESAWARLTLDTRATTSRRAGSHSVDSAPIGCTFANYCEKQLSPNR